VQVTNRALYARGWAKSVSPAAMELAQFVMVAEKGTWGNSLHVGYSAKTATEQAGENHRCPIGDNDGLNLW
jgi:hypothetical protein